MKKFTLLFAVCAPLALFSQSTLGGPDSTSVQSNKSAGETILVAPVQQGDPVQGDVFTITERMPEFPGGQSALAQYLSRNIQYPIDARELGIEGKVYLSFVVNTKGQVRDVRILRGIYASIDKEAMRVVKMMPLWKPATQDGKPVNVQFNLPINFQLQ